MMNKLRLADRLYLAFATLSLVMFFYAHAPFMPEKLFYVPCALTLVASFFCPFRHDRVDTLLLLIIGLALLSDVVNYTLPRGVESPWVRQGIGILCFRKLRHYDLRPVTKALVFVAPIIVASYYLFSSPFAEYRYGGFSGDPNYLSISLTLLIAILLVYTHQKGTSRGVVVVAVATIVMTLPLFFAMKSRMGIMAFAVMLLGEGVYLFEHNKRMLTLVVVAVFMTIGPVSVMFSEEIAGLTDRFDTLEESRGGPRADMVKGVHDVFMAYPSYFVFGNGIDVSPASYAEYSAYSDQPIHTTYVNIFFHQGLFVLAIFLLLLWRTFQQVWCSGSERPIYLALFLSLLMNIGSVPSMTYLTFWWTLFFLLSVKPQRALMPSNL